jgi:ketosteroid isomerase-like protein
MTSMRSEVEKLLAKQRGAIEAKDLDGLMSLYAAEVVYYDVVPPLQYVGAAALRGRFSTWFDGYRGRLSMEVRELRIWADGEMAVAHWLSKVGGTLKDGRAVGSWVRATSCFGRIGDALLIFHEHVSLPADPASGRAATDLLP